MEYKNLIFNNLRKKLMVDITNLLKKVLPLQLFLKKHK
jgi:hypothetical protein